MFFKVLLQILRSAPFKQLTKHKPIRCSRECFVLDLLEVIQVSLSFLPRRTFNDCEFIQFKSYERQYFVNSLAQPLMDCQKVSFCWRRPLLFGAWLNENKGSNLRYPGPSFLRRRLWHFHEYKAALSAATFEATETRTAPLNGPLLSLAEVTLSGLQATSYKWGASRLRWVTHLERRE